MLTERNERRGQEFATSGWVRVSAVLAVLAGFLAGSHALGMTGLQGFGLRRHGQRHMPSVDDQIQQMTKDLNLNDEQQTKIKPILQDQRKQMQQLREDSSLSRDERVSKMRGVHEQASTQIRALLNEDQQKKFDEIQQKRRERWQSRQGGKGDNQ